MTVVITGCIIGAGLMIRQHYDTCGRLLSAGALFATTTRAARGRAAAAAPRQTHRHLPRGRQPGHRHAYTAH
jgi:hypothetical protein